MPRIILANVLLIFFLANAQAQGQQQKRSACPSDATSASVSLWPMGAVQRNQKVRGTHACGRQIECVGGTSTAARTRSCRWL